MSNEEWWKHLDHELSQLIELREQFGDEEAFAKYPEVVRRSMDVAYGAHLRALLEVMHDGRLPRAEVDDRIGASQP